MKVKISTTFILLLFCILIGTEARSYQQYPSQAYPQQTYNQQIYNRQTYNQNYSQDYADDYTDYEGGVEIGYPAIDALERKVLGGAYAQENVYQRLNRLETKIFGHASNESLYERVEKLESTVGIEKETDSRLAGRNRNVIFGSRNSRYNSYSDGENSYYSDDYHDEYDSYDSDDYYDRQTRYGQYGDMSTEANVLSLIFMILQAFL